MSARLHSIVSRAKDHAAKRAMLEDFALDGGVAAAADCVLSETGWSLYCLHQPTQSAVFVQTPADCDLTETPFMRMAQFDHASHALLVHWHDLDRLAAQVPLPKNLILVFNIGRSGTTLVSRMLGLVNGVTSLSEPNAQLDATMNRKANGPALTRKLIAACTRLQCRQPDGTVPHTLAIKTYSQSLFNCADYHAVFPDAKYVFLYRDAVSWANSLYKMARGFGMPEKLDDKMRAFVWNIASGANDISIFDDAFSKSGDTTHHEEISAASWALHMDTYMQNLHAGVPFLALRYNEMNADRENTTKTLLKHCGLSAAAVASAIHGFDKDSQDGSGIGQDNKIAGFTLENVERFLKAMAHHRSFSDPNLLLPDIYHPDRLTSEIPK